MRLPVDEVAVEQGCWFDQAAADLVCNFFERNLKLSAGRFAGQPFVLAPWQRDFLSRLFGWKREDGTRRYREAYLEIPKKNGKSTLIAGILIYLMIEEPGAEVYPGAVNSKQAAIVYREVARMIRKSPALRKHFRVMASYKTVVFDRNEARLECLTADVESKDGINSSGTILDELHRFPNRNLYDVVKYAGTARDQPILISITTAGTDRFSICFEVHEIARKILEGATENIEFLGVIYAASETDDLDDPAVWRKANPSMGQTLTEAGFAADWADAKLIPGRLNNFKRLRFNIWTRQASLWLPLDAWDACADPVNLAWWRGRKTYAALDLSTVRDLTALTLCTLDDKVAQTQDFYFVPEDTIPERVAAGVPYEEWAAQGHVLETPGNSTDFERIRQFLNNLKAAGIQIDQVGIDPWNAAHLASLLIEDGFTVVEIRQTYGNLSGPSKELERRILARTIAHCGSPVTRWCVGNVAIETDAMGNIRPSKRRSSEKIDGVVSEVMALGMATHACYNDPVPGITVI